MGKLDISRVRGEKSLLSWLLLLLLVIVLSCAACSRVPVVASQAAVLTGTPAEALAAVVLPAISIQLLERFPSSANTGDKPQSKVWRHGGRWWTVMPDVDGTHLFRLDDLVWSKSLRISPDTDTHADTLVDGDVTHILLYRGVTSSLVSVEYVPETSAYRSWIRRQTPARIDLDAGVETATCDLDAQGRMWLASTGVAQVNVRWSDPPYADWSQPITLATGILDDDICAVVALPPNRIAVMWSNQASKRFGFRTHTVGEDPSVWSVDEIPAAQSALNVGDGMADDHIHLAATADGTLYAAVKTSYDAPGMPKLALLVRRPSGLWDDLHVVDQQGSRPIVLLSESTGTLMMAYNSQEVAGDIVCKRSLLSAIAFGPRQMLLPGAINASSTKQGFVDEVVVIGYGTDTRSAIVRISPTP